MKILLSIILLFISSYIMNNSMASAQQFISSVVIDDTSMNIETNAFIVDKDATPWPALFVITHNDEDHDSVIYLKHHTQTVNTIQYLFYKVTKYIDKYDGVEISTDDKGNVYSIVIGKRKYLK
jgi:hypothetical protein